ncbi:MAG: thioredoxin [Armatimonadetes bacterium]|nr:thioredoxin [Armatimonadota bacterium]
MSSAQAVTTATFQSEVLDSGVPVLVDFWAVWCGPCKAVAPTVDALAAEYAGKVKVVKVDVDQEPQIAAKYGIRSIPTLMVFKGGQLVDQAIGAVPKQHLAGMLDKALAS